MPIIIWGSRAITSTLEHGEFFCPRCNAPGEYSLKRVRPWFTLYFIPFFPIGGGQRYVECDRCRQPYPEDVLHYQPPNETDRFLAEVYDDLKGGTSVDALQRKLVRQGMAESEAEQLLTKMCEGKPQQCTCGQRFHPDVRECMYCGGNL
jgi:zinc ribbon protein